MAIISITLQVLLAVAFLGAGVTKVIGTQQHIKHFEQWRYPQWFRTVTGLVEVIGAAGMAVGIWVPEVGLLAGLWLGATMLGAVYTHLIRVKEGLYPPAALLLVLSVVAAILRGMELL